MARRGLNGGLDGDRRDKRNIERIAAAILGESCAQERKTGVEKESSWFSGQQELANTSSGRRKLSRRIGMMKDSR